MELARIRRGATISGDSHSPMGRLPPWMDFDRYRRGQEFFVKHCAGVIFALHNSLTIGFVITPLLNTLVFNRASDTPGKALRRYVETLIHVILWHTTDVWDSVTPSSGHLSLSFVRRVHNRVARAMNGSRKHNQVNNSIHNCVLVQLQTDFDPIKLQILFGQRLTWTLDFRHDGVSMPHST